LSRAQWISLKLGVVTAGTLVAIFVIPTWRWLSAISTMILLLLLVGAGLWVLLEYTTYGRHIRAIGSNRAAAELAGVPVKRQIVKTFVLGGTIGALAGIALAASQASAAPDAAANFLLPAFAAAFLSTVVLSHGRFTVPGTLIGGIFIVWVGLALIIGGVAPTWVSVVNGAILLGAVGLSTTMRRT
jgi:ribose/xylose/arabinose/galactoside ABC-type transport system permease subunit